jgi:hypothetical protein
MDYKKIMIGALGTLADGTVFKRSQVLEHIVSLGYAERTAIHALTPSRPGGMFNRLIAAGAIEPHGPRSYRILDMKKIKKPEAARRVPLYLGEPKAGWDDLGLMSDPELHKIEWHLCGKEYAPGSFSLKLYADGRVPYKANYWMRWNNGRLYGDDVATLIEHHRDIYENVVNDMRAITEA